MGDKQPRVSKSERQGEESYPTIGNNLDLLVHLLFDVCTPSMVIDQAPCVFELLLSLELQGRIVRINQYLVS